MTDIAGDHLRFVSLRVHFDRYGVGRDALHDASQLALQPCQWHRCARDGVHHHPEGRLRREPSVTITSYDEAFIEGTFAFVGYDQVTTMDTRDVTEGSFRIAVR